MKEGFKDDTFLARWLNNELTEKELAAFKASADYPLYQKLVQGSDNIVPASFDRENLLAKIKEEQNRELGVRRGRKTWVYGVAAALAMLLCFGIYSIFSISSETIILSDFGEKKTITLPDGSEVLLNANSQLAYNEDTWSESRRVKLTGEAYFIVEKGSDFTVQSETGLVSVLGTQFNIQDIEGFYEVSCYEGSVQVSSDDEVEVLKPKHAVRKFRQKRLVRRSIDQDQPSWKENRSTFSQVPLKSVLVELQNQYGITFDGVEKLGNMTYSGTFPHDDLTLSLKLVLGSLQIKYKIGEDDVVTLED